MTKLFAVLLLFHVKLIAHTFLVEGTIMVFNPHESNVGQRSVCLAGSHELLIIRAYERIILAECELIVGKGATLHIDVERVASVSPTTSIRNVVCKHMVVTGHIHAFVPHFLVHHVIVTLVEHGTVVHPTVARQVVVGIETICLVAHGNAVVDVVGRRREVFLLHLSAVTTTLEAIAVAGCFHLVVLPSAIECPAVVEFNGRFASDKVEPVVTVLHALQPTALFPV